MWDVKQFEATLNPEELRAWEALDEQQKYVHTKFPPDSWLADPHHTLHFFMWTTFYRRNLDIAAEDYFGIALYLYQKIMLFLMGVSDFIVFIMARADAKSFIISIYSSIVSVLYPGSEIVLTSGTRGQAKLIISKKLNRDLLGKNIDKTMLPMEIAKVNVSGDEGRVNFHNGSSIDTVTLGDSGLGNRSTVNVFEEAKTCNKQVIDKVISPFSHVRPLPFLAKEPYASASMDDIKNSFIEEPKEIYISSSIEETHWLYKLAIDTAQNMILGKPQVFLALDYAVSLQHMIRTPSNLKNMRRKVDGITWAVEYENRVFRSDTKAYFGYSMIKENRTLAQPFLPRKTDDYLNNRKNIFAIPKQAGEKRVVSCDIASVNRKANDNSAYSCLRLFPEQRAMSSHKDYRVQVPYIEAKRGSELRKQAIRIRQLYEDFEADYIVLDLRNCGVSLYYILARPLYDPERCIEYPPLSCMNDSELASQIANENAQPVIYVISATSDLNMQIAQNLHSYLTERQIDFLIPKEEAVPILQTLCPSYLTLPPEEQLYYERPYMETAFLINEMVELVYEINSRTGTRRLTEKSGKMKDRYSSVSYGCYFVQQLALDMISNEMRSSYSSAPSCVSSVSW